MEKEDISGLQKLVEAVDSVSKRNKMGDWVSYHAMLIGLKEGKIDYAIGAANIFFNYTERGIDFKLAKIMRGGDSDELEPIMVTVEKAWDLYGDDSTEEFFWGFRYSIGEYAYSPDAYEDGDVEGDDMAYYDIYLQLMACKCEEPVGEIHIEEALEEDWISHLQLLIIKMRRTDPENASTRLAEILPYEKSKSNLMNLVLQKENVPILPNRDYLIRSRYYDLEPGLREYILGSLKLTNDPIDQMNFAEIKDLSMDKIIKKKDLWAVETKFLDRNLVRDSDWILKAIKYNCIDCLRILLEERVPLPSANQITAALNKSRCNVDEYMNLYEKYAQFYSETGLPVNEAEFNGFNAPYDGSYEVEEEEEEQKDEEGEENQQTDYNCDSKVSGRELLGIYNQSECKIYEKLVKISIKNESGGGEKKSSTKSWWELW